MATKRFCGILAYSTAWFAQLQVDVTLVRVPSGLDRAIRLKAIEQPVHFRDLHATLLCQMGLEQNALSHFCLGRERRLTEGRGEILRLREIVT